MIKVISLFLVLLISSCADNQKREEWREEKLTCDQTLQNVSFDSLRTKMAINSLYAKASFDMLTNNERVNENEKALLRELALVYEDCYEKKSYSLTGGSKYIDILRNIDRQSADIHLALIADLYNQKLTFGEYNQHRNTLNNETVKAYREFQSKLDEIDRQDRRDYRMSQPIICNAVGLTIYCK